MKPFNPFPHPDAEISPWMPRGMTEPSCGGLGVLNCYCGGDLCVCHHHGEVECPGCPDCRETEEEDEC